MTAISDSVVKIEPASLGETPPCSREGLRTPLISLDQSSASLYRTPSSKLRNRVRKRQTSDRHGASSGGVLVTQLHEREEEEGSDYDTDLEEEGSVRSNRATLEQLYEHVCEKFGVVPASYFLRNMKAPELQMQHHGLGPNGTKALAFALQVNTTISNLDLEGNCMQAEGARHIIYMLQENIAITQLNLGFNALGSAGAAEICRALRKSINITHLNLAGNNITDSDASFIQDLIESNTHIKHLNLSNNGFSAVGAAKIGKALGRNSAIEHFDLSWNHVRLEGADGFARCLTSNSTLQYMNLSMNGFSDRGAKVLADGLQADCSIHELDLTNNRITGTGLRALAKALATNTELKILRVGLNPVSCGSAMDVLKTVQDHEESALQMLDLRAVVVTPEFMNLVKEVQQSRTSFKIRVGHITKSLSVEGDDPEGSNMNPLEILLIFMAENNLRLVDLFKSLDKDQSMSLTRDEFIDGLKDINTPMTHAQLDKLIDMLDQDGDGEVDLKEIMNINKEYRDIKMKAAQTAKKNKAARAKNKLRGAMNAVLVAQQVAPDSIAENGGRDAESTPDTAGQQQNTDS